VAIDRSFDRRRFLTGAAGAVVAGATIPLLGNALTSPASADELTTIFGDFEKARLANSAHVNNPAADAASWSTAVVSHGSHSLEYDVAGSSVIADNTPQITLYAGTNFTKVPWSPHLIIAWDVMSDSPTELLGRVTFKDSKGGAWGHGMYIPPFGLHPYNGYVRDIANGGVDVDDIVEIDMSLPRQPWPIRVFFDCYRLVNAWPYDQSPYLNAITPGILALMRLPARIQQQRAALRGLRHKIPPTDTPADRALDDQAAAIDADLAALSEQARSAGLDLAAGQEINQQLNTAINQIERLGDVIQVRQANPGNADYGLAAADSMVLVFPKDKPCAFATSPAALEMAAGEYQSTQAVVMPYAADLTGVAATVSAVTDADGQPVDPSVLSASVHPVGFLNVTPSSAYHGASDPTGWYKGWTPDPIRDDLSSVDVAAGDFQPFWVTAYASPTAAAGDYRIEVTVSADGAATQTLAFPVTVWPFAIADRPIFTTAFNYNIDLIAPLYGLTDPDAVTALSHQYEDFLETYKIEPGNIYAAEPPTVEFLTRIQQKWGLRHFNVIYLNYTKININDPSSWQAQIDSWVGTITDAMAEYQKAGLDKLAYVYGFDEQPAKWYPVIRQTLSAIKAKFPDLPAISTVRDPSLGTESGLAGLVDFFAPEMDLYDQAAADAAHARGTGVYWYPDIATGHPYPNWFNGYPAIDARTLMGPMSHQAKVDGMIYYQTTRWTSGQTILDDGIFSNWNPYTFSTTAGDGSILYPGPEGPMAGVRLANIRDGMQDYNLLALLAERISDAPNTTPADVLATAQRLLEAQDVVQGPRNYTEDPAVYRSWRADVAASIAALGS
jgi:hypothetical protein